MNAANALYLPYLHDFLTQKVKVIEASIGPGGSVGFYGSIGAWSSISMVSRQYCGNFMPSPLI